MLGPLLAVHAAISRAASSAVNRSRTSVFTCSIDRSEWDDETLSCLLKAAIADHRPIVPGNHRPKIYETGSMNPFQ
jgi:hypothetical protein